MRADQIDCWPVLFTTQWSCDCVSQKKCVPSLPHCPLPVPKLFPPPEPGLQKALVLTQSWGAFGAENCRLNLVLSN